MSVTSRSRHFFARSGSSSTRVLLCVLAFVATGMIVIRMRPNRADVARQYSATARVQQYVTPSESGSRDRPKEPLDVDPRAVQQQIMSDENLAAALHQLEGSGDALVPEDRETGTAIDVQQLRKSLQVSAETPSSGRIQVSVSWSDRDASRAVHLVNAIATAYADEHGAKQEAVARREYLEAQEAADRARQQYMEAQGRFDDFVGQHFLKEQALAEQARERAAQLAVERASDRAAEPGRVKSLPPTPDDQVTRPPVVANPERLELEGEIAELEEQRARLLTSRTPLHPEVRDLDLRIDGVRQRLASLPDEVPGQLAGPSSTGQGPTLNGPDAVSQPDPAGQSAMSNDAPPPRDERRSAQQTAEEYAQAVQAFRVHKETLDQARAEYDRLSEIKRRAWERQLRCPHVEVELARGCEASVGADASPRPWMAALAAGLAVAFGVGLISAGFDTDLPLTTLEEAETALPIPIVGTIPLREPSSGDDLQEPVRRLGGGAKVFLGVLVIAVCFGVLVLLP
jgi:capsular polysaccharide biosynthesis protein